MRLSHALLGAVVGAQVAYSRLPQRALVGATKGIVGLVTAASAAETVEARGPARAARLLGAAAATGFAAELVGTRTGRPFGRYAYSSLLGPKVRDVPLLAAAPWTMMARPAWVVAGLTSQERLKRIALAGGALAAWDVFIDPRMVRDGYWTWPAGGRYEDVPWTNFAGWWLVGSLGAALTSVLDPDDDPVYDGDGALALYVWTWVGETFANAVLWRRPRVAVAGGLAMGAFAVPAVLTRSRRRAAGTLPA